MISHIAKEGENIINEKDEMAMQVLTRYEWPGNVRQLKNVIEAAIALSGQKFIDIDIIKQFIELPEDIYDSKEPLGDYSKSIENFEKEYFKNLLAKNKGDIEMSAKEAGINIATLYRKIKKLNITRD